MVTTTNHYQVNDINWILNEVCGTKITKSSKKIEYYELPCCFDIEVSSFYSSNRLDEKVAIMYEWSFCLNGYVIIGRTWSEWENLCSKIVTKLNLNENKRLVIYVHNLSYEFQFIRKHFEWESVFALESRKVVKATTMDGIEFRCSMLLSGYGLAKLAEQLTEHNIRKMEGDLDYDLIRTEKTPLTEKEIGYCVNDVVIVVCYIEELIHRLGSITKIPLTKTGFVREYCRNACMYDGGHTKNTKKYLQYRKLMNKLTLDLNTFSQLQRAFSGGFTHANAMWQGEIIHNVGSYDFTSSYPYVMVSEKFPMSTPELISIKNKQELNDNLKYYCCLFDIEFEKIESKVLYENYISKSHCTLLENQVENNGRIVKADKLKITITEQDYFIIKKLYKWKNSQISNFRRFAKGYLPTNLVKSILDLYKTKTELKDVKGKEVEYLNSKEQANSAYGMMVTNPCRDEILYNDDLWDNLKPDIEESLKKYNKSVKRFLYYAWGIWVTAYARSNLFTGIYEFKNDYIYSDTDSIKVLNVSNHLDYISNYNKLVYKKLETAMNYHNLPIELTRPKNKYGKEKPLGIWSYEGEYQIFKTLGAKRYMTKINDKISLTVSGVNKKFAIPYLINKYGDNIFKAFDDGLCIPADYTGKSTHTYIDEVREGYVTDYLGEECYYKELSGVHLEKASYDMSISETYARYLLGIKEIKYYA